MAQDNPVEELPEGSAYIKVLRPASDDRVVVVDKEGRGYLAKSKKLKQTVAWQPAKLDQLEEAYDFEKEIRERMPNIKQIRRHLLSLGIAEQADLDDPKKRQLFDNVFPKLNG